MKKTWIVAAAVAVLWGIALDRAHAQAVYKCNSRSYSQQPCSARIVGDDAPTPANAPVRNLVTRQLPGESVAAFNTRKHRAGLSDTDRDECARLDKKMAVDQERMKSAREEEVDDAQSSLTDSRKRFRQLRC